MADEAAPVGPIAIEWRPREPPLVAGAVVAWDDGARRLATRALAAAWPPGALAAVAAADALVLVGDYARLPWVDGAVYLARDPHAPSLYLPTTLSPTVPLTLLERALITQFPTALVPLAIVPRAGRVVVLPVGGARLVDREILGRYVNP